MTTMPDRRRNHRPIGGSEIPSDAMLYHQQQAAWLQYARMMMVCGAKILSDQLVIANPVFVEEKQGDKS